MNKGQVRKEINAVSSALQGLSPNWECTWPQRISDRFCFLFSHRFSTMMTVQFRSTKCAMKSQK